MKFIKRLFPLLLLLALLVGCFAFPVSAGEYDDYRFCIIDVFGAPKMLVVNAGSDWGVFFHPEYPNDVIQEGEDYVIKTYAGYVVFVSDRDNDGVDERYRLAYNTSTGLTFVNSQSKFISYFYEDFLPYYSDDFDSEVLQVFDHYDLECKLNFSFEGTLISLLYPSNVWHWKDIVSVDAPENSVLGDYSFAVSGNYIYLVRNMPSGAFEKYMLLNQWNNPVYSTDIIFSGNSAESSLITLVPICTEGLHSFTEQVVTAATCSDVGLRVITCSKCPYSCPVVIPAKGHNMTLVEEHTAKCPELGYKIMECARCSKTEKVALPIEHTYTTVSCTQDSYCTGCGHLAIKALGHDRNIWGTCRTCGSNAVSDFFTGGGADNSGGDSGNTDGGAGGGAGNESEGNFYDGVGDALNNAGNAIGNWWNDVWNKNDSGSNDKPDSSDSNWFLDWLGLSDLGKKMGSFFKTILAIGGLCLVIGFWPKLSKFFKWVGRGFAAIWKSIKKFFKSLTKKRKKK